MEERAPLLGNEAEGQPHTRMSQPIVYRRRWWLLFLFSLSGFVQNIVWNTWGPIAQSAKEVFGWSDAQIGMFPNWGNIAYILTVFLASYFMDERGLRISVLTCNGLILVGAGVRCITSIPEYATWLMNLAAVLNGIAGTVFFAGPALIAAIWFPSGQRTTATAIASFSNNAGFAVTFLLGPQLVASPEYNNTVNSVKHIDSMMIVPSNTSHNHTVLVNFEQLKNDIMRLMYYECAIAGVVFLAALVYFPDKPPTAPSFTATVNRVDYLKAFVLMETMEEVGVLRAVPAKHTWDGGKALLFITYGNGPLWLVSLASAIPAGMYGVWGSVLDIILDPVGVKQTEAGWIGFYAVIAGCVASLVVARFSDIFMKHMKLFLVLLYVFGGGSFLWFTLTCIKVIPFSTSQLYASCILGGLFSNACLPLFYELASETSYPVAEGITGAFLTILNNMFGVMFLLALQIPHIGTSWMNWALLGGIGVGLLCLLAFPETYARTNLDLARRLHTDIVVDIQGPDEPDNSDKLQTEIVSQ